MADKSVHAEATEMLGLLLICHDVLEYVDNHIIAN